jgi:hypothetical protein
MITEWRNDYYSTIDGFKKSTNQKQVLPVAAMFVNELGRNEHSL